VPTVNEVNPSIDQTVRIFDQFYNYSANVPAEEYDAVVSYFKSVFTTDAAAGNFAVALFRIADETNTPVLTILQTLEGQDALTLTQTLFFLNHKLNSERLRLFIYIYILVAT
jgi:hypothetical protein